MKIFVFTNEYEGITDTLTTQCSISESFNINDAKSGLETPRIKNFIAIWDTGATGSVISKRVVKELDLQPTGKLQMFHAGGGGDYVNSYSVNIFLPNNTVFYIKNATEAELNGTDVLIGMDIISSGDFAVTTSKGKTKFSFQVPSTHDIDFIKEHRQKMPAVKERTPGRNDPCPCGSGKKYKHCCGKKS